MVTPSVVTKTVCAPSGAFAAIVNVAVIVVGLVTVALFAVIPVPLKLIMAGEKKFVPVSVIVPVVVPCALIVWLSETSVGAASTVNCTMLVEVPPVVVTNTKCIPVEAPAATANVAVSDVALVTLMFEAVIPVPLKLIVVFPTPIWKFVPVRVSLIIPPCPPMVTLRLVSAGAGRLTVNCTMFEVVTPSVVTKTVCAPSGAFAAIVNVAVMVVALVTVTLFAVIPVPLKLIMAGEKKFVPVSVIVGVVVPCALVVWLSEVSVGGGSTVKDSAFEVPAEVMTVMFCAPVVAVEEITNCVVMLVVLTTFVFCTVTPAPLNSTVLLPAPVTKLVPVMVRLTVVP